MTYTDDTLPGFGVRVSQGGVKAFVMVTGRNRRRITIGRYPALTLQDAHEKARAIAPARTLSKEEVPAPKFEDAIPIFLGSRYPAKAIKQSTRHETERLLRRHFLPPVRHELLSEIPTHEIAWIMDRLLKTPGEARHTLGAVPISMKYEKRSGPGKPGQRPC